MTISLGVKHLHFILQVFRMCKHVCTCPNFALKTTVNALCNNNNKHLIGHKTLTGHLQNTLCTLLAVCPNKSNIRPSQLTTEPLMGWNQGITAQKEMRKEAQECVEAWHHFDVSSIVWRRHGSETEGSLSHVGAQLFCSQPHPWQCNFSNLLS